MPIDDKTQPIVVKRIKKHGHGHHGGAWKVAYADFVTAMMAFFLLMWLLGSTGAYERQAISDFFQNPSAVDGPGGASTSMIDLGGAMDVPMGEEGDPMKGEDHQERELDVDISELEQEKAKLDELMQKLKEQIENTPSLKEFQKQLLLDITTEGLRIQIVDDRNRPMFGSGSAQLKWYTREILHDLAKTLSRVPNHLSVSGHTDAVPFYSEDNPGYTNWELSADRANAARRELIYGSLPEEKFGRVVGLASSVLFNRENPRAPINRRISIIVLNRATERAIGLLPEGVAEKMVEEAEEGNGINGTEFPTQPDPQLQPQDGMTPEPDTPEVQGSSASEIERELVDLLEGLPPAR